MLKPTFGRELTEGAIFGDYLGMRLSMRLSRQPLIRL